MSVWESPQVNHPHSGKIYLGPGMSVYIQRLGSAECYEHEHEQTQLIFAMGRACCEVSWRSPRGRKHQALLRGGDLWIIPMDVRHAKKWMDGAELLILYLGGHWLSQYKTNRLNRVSIESVHELCVREPLIGGLLSELRKHVQLKRIVDAQIVALSYCLASRVIASLNEKPRKQGEPVRRLSVQAMKKVKDYIASHLAEPIDFAGLAREAGLSTGHFGVLFKATMGMTPTQYILRTRLLKAKEIIGKGDHTIGQVAYLTGFSDHSHLSTQFRRFFGAPPKSFLPDVRTV